MDYQDIKTPWEGWRVINKIGKGGFGSVYEIERSQYGIQEHAAMKVITIPQSADEIDDLLIEGYDDNSITQRFDAFAEDIVREYGMMAQMKGNANIVYCDDYRIIQQDNGFGRDIYIRMELLTPLLKAMDRVSSELQIIRFGMEMCNALEACQKRNVLHRDIKPQNIFVSEDGVFKLGDFGIARKAEKTTRATVGKGTYQFMAPEVKNELPYGPTVDMYSLGLVMYWLLNNRRSPFFPLPPAVPTHKEEQEALRRRFSGEKIPAPKNGSEELKQIVLKACAFDPKDRYQTAREMREDLMRLSGGQTTDLGQEHTRVLDFCEDTCDRTVGLNFKSEQCDDMNDHGQTVGPVFGRDSVSNSEKTIGPDFSVKEKREKKNKKQKGNKVYATVAALLTICLFCCLIIFEINTENNDGTVLSDSRDSNETRVNTQWETVNNSSGDRNITIAASSNPNSGIMKRVSELLEEENYTVTFIEAEDIYSANYLVENGEADANLAQTSYYLNKFNSEHGTELIGVIPVYCMPYGIFPGIKSSIAALEDGDIIAIPSEEHALTRALFLLQNAGIIKIEPGAGPILSIADITDNPLNIEICSIDAAQLGNVRDSVALSVFNSAEVVFSDVNLDTDALFVENVESIELDNCWVLAVREGTESSEKVQALMCATQSETIKSYILETYGYVAKPVNGRVDIVEDANSSAQMPKESIVVKVVAGEVHNVALYSDGTVKSSGLDYHGEGNVEDWCEIIDVCATECLTVGLKRDGSVVAAGRNTDGQCNVSDWTDITAIAASGYNVIGVKRDGTVEAVGNNDYGQCNVDSWTGIVQADIGTTHSVGLRADGTVVATGDNEYGQCNVSEWTDIVSVKVAYLRTIGLKADGTVVATGGNFDGECDVSSWTHIVAIDTDGNHTVGLRADGTVVAAGFNSWESYDACDVSEWTDITYVDVGFYRTIGLKSDGTIVVTGWNNQGQCNISGLSLQ